MKKKTLYDALFQEAIRDVIKKALRTKPIKLHCPSGDMEGFEIDGEIYTEYLAIRHLLEDYSWAQE